MKTKKWHERFPLWGMIGAILIFLSWLFQNQLLSNASEERIKLENTQVSIDLQEIRMEMWHKAYVEEKTKQNPDTQILLNTSFKTLQSYLNIIAWSSVRVRKDELDKQNDIKNKYQAHENLANWYKNKNLKALETDLGTAIKLEHELNFEKQFSEKYGKNLIEIDEKVNFYTKVFIFLYICGSILVSVDFMLKLKSIEEKPNDKRSK